MRRLASKGFFLYIVFSVWILMSLWHHTGNMFVFRTNHPLAGTTINMESGIWYQKAIRHRGGTLQAISLVFGTNGKSREGRLTVKLIDQNEQVLETWTQDTALLADNRVHEFACKKRITLTDEGCYSLAICDEYQGDNGICIYTAQDGGDLVSDHSVYADTGFSYQLTYAYAKENRIYRVCYMIIVLLLLVMAGFFIDFIHFHYIKNAFVVLAVVLLIRLCDYDVLQNIVTTVSAIEYEENQSEAVIAPGEKVKKKFNSDRMDFHALEFFVEDENNADFHMTIKHKESGAVIYDNHVTSEDLTGDGRFQKHVLLLQSEKGFPKGSYTVVIRNKGKENLNIGITGKGALNVYAEKQTFIGRKITMGILLLLSAALIFLIGYALEHLRFEKIYLTIAIPIMISYLILYPPHTTPDSEMHFLASYRLSNMMIGHTGEEEWYGRQEDIDFWNTVWGYLWTHKDLVNPSVANYETINSSMHLLCEKPEWKDLPVHVDKMKYYSIFSYFPEAVGFALGKLLHLSAFWMLYLGRIFMALFYLLAVYHAIKIIPVGKGLIAFISLVPIAAMMGSALGYDGMVEISTICFIASVLALYKNITSRKRLLETMVWAFIVGSVKGGGYLLLLPLVFILFMKSEWKSSLKKIVLICAAGAGSVLFFNKIMTIGLDLFQFGVEGNGMMQTSFALEHPLTYVNMVMKTFVAYLDALTLNTVGTHMARLEPTLPYLPSALLLIATGLYSMFEDDELILTKKHKCWFMAVIAIGLIATPAMLLSATPSASSTVEGIQGRYFLPLLPLVFFVLTKFSLKVPISENGQAREKIRNRMIRIFAIVSFAIVYYLLRKYMLRA